MDVLTRLLQRDIITQEQLQAIESIVLEKGISYEEALIEQGVEKDQLRAEYADMYAVPVVEQTEHEIIPESVLSYLAEESARHYMMMPIRIEDGILLVGAVDPDNLQIREVLNFISTKHNIPYKLGFMLQSDLDKAFTAYESLSGEVDDALDSLEGELDNAIAKSVEESQSGVDEKEDLAHIKEDAPVTKIVATILRYAVDGGASDIHIEPTTARVMVRFRVDGVLQKSLELPRNVHSAVVARVKILSNMRLDEKRKPQDGRFSATFDERKVDFRVSSLPTNHGEKVVMRILDTERGVSSLSDTGISNQYVEMIKQVVQEPYGIILVSGPTGSGKSTTLYSMLGEVDKQGHNVLSLEDPVEYNIDGVSQSQVRPEIGYTFASGLRSALRQDPDIIMVGEIRDKETAQLAIQAALTGHLVLSTIHTNNSIGVVPRLIDMGVDPYLIAPTLKLAIAQRLARRICPDTGLETPIEGSIKNMIDDSFSTLPSEYHNNIPSSETILYPEPSAGCASGTKGRVAVMEAFRVDDEIQQLILSGGSEEDMYNAARKNGFMTMKEDAIIKALEHVIPFGEVSAFGSQIDAGNIFDDNTQVDDLSPQAAVDNQLSSLGEDLYNNK